MQPITPFVGREAEMDHFKQLVENRSGALWVVQGGPGIGKSRLLAECRKGLEAVKHPHIFLDLRGQQPTEGETLLRDLCRAASPSVRLNALAQGEMVSVITELERHEPGIRKYFEYAAPLLDKQEKGPVGFIFQVILAGLEVLFASAKRRKEALKRELEIRPEKTLLDHLADEGKQRPVLFIDTFECALNINACLQTHLLFMPGQKEPLHNANKASEALSRFLLALFRMLTHCGWVVVVAGRQFIELPPHEKPTTLARLEKHDVSRMLDPLLAGLLCSQTEHKALASKVWNLGFRGNPLWVNAVTYWVGKRLQAGDSPQAISQDSGLACQLDSIPLTPNSHSSEIVRCKAEILKCIAAGQDLPLERLWQLALPQRLDETRLNALFDDTQAREILNLAWQAGLCTGGSDIEESLLHEEVRDVLLWWAGDNGLLGTKKVRDSYKCLLEALKLEHPDWADVSWPFGPSNQQKVLEEERRSLTGTKVRDWYYEAIWYAMQGSENLIAHGYTPDDYAARVLASVSLSPFEKWRVAEKLESLSRFQFMELLKTFQEETEGWVELFGNDSALALAEAVRRGEATDVNDTIWWRSRAESVEDIGAYIGLFASLEATKKYTELNIHPEQLQEWSAKMLRLYDANPASPLREQMTKALYSKGVNLGQLQKPEAAITTYDEIITRFGDDSEPAIREQVAKALYNKGVTLGQLQKPEAAITTYDEIITRFGDDSEPAIREQVATALYNKGVTLGQLQKPETAITTYDEIIIRFSDDSEPALRELVAMALYNKGVTLRQLQKPEAAITTFNESITRFGDDSEPAIRELVAKALNNKGVILGQLQKPETAITTYDEIITRFGDDSEPAIREQVAMALHNKGVTLLLQAKQQWRQHQHDARTKLKMASHCFAVALSGLSEHDRPMVLGNQAYTGFLLGDDETRVRSWLRQALQLGGESLYQGTLNDLATHTIPPDEGMRTLLEDVWLR